MARIVIAYKFLAERRRALHGLRGPVAESVEGDSLEDTHECDRQRWLDYQMFQHRGGVAQLEVELGVSLETPHGRFACSTRNDNDEGRPGWISARS